MPKKKRKKIAPLEGLALVFLRHAYDWSQTRLAAALGMKASLLCQYETGEPPLTREKLEAFAAPMEVREGAIEEALLAAARLRGGSREEPLGGPGEPTPAELRALQGALARADLAGSAALHAEALRFLRRERVGRDRAEAAELWETLKKRPAEGRRALVEGAREFQTWAMAERLAHESERAAAADARRAMELARLAQTAAALAPVTEAWRPYLLGYCQAFVGNSHRVAGDLAGAQQAFAEADRLWVMRSGTGCWPLDEFRMLDLKASLRRGERRFPEALALLDQAFRKNLSGEAAARVLLKRSATLEQMGDAEGALVALRQAAPHVDGEREPRQLCVLKFNIAATLCDLGRIAEAAPLVQEVRSLAFRLGNELDIIRALWLDGKVAAGTGRFHEAAAALRQVRGEFATRENAYDTALSTLDLAGVLAEEDRTAEVQTLARQALPHFVVRGIAREALAALQLFVEAAAREAVTAEFARQLAARVKRARLEAPPSRPEAKGTAPPSPARQP